MKIANYYTIGQFYLVSENATIFICTVYNEHYEIIDIGEKAEMIEGKEQTIAKNYIKSYKKTRFSILY